LLLATSEKGKVATEKGTNNEGREANDEGKTIGKIETECCNFVEKFLVKDTICEFELEV